MIHFTEHSFIQIQSTTNSYNDRLFYHLFDHLFEYIRTSDFNIQVFQPSLKPLQVVVALLPQSRVTRIMVEIQAPAGYLPICVDRQLLSSVRPYEMSQSNQY